MLQFCRTVLFPLPSRRCCLAVYRLPDPMWMQRYIYMTHKKPLAQRAGDEGLRSELLQFWDGLWIMKISKKCVPAQQHIPAKLSRKNKEMEFHCTFGSSGPHFVKCHNCSEMSSVLDSKIHTNEATVAPLNHIFFISYFLSVSLLKHVYLWEKIR